jgi:CheY-like chemotaxis protein
MKGSWPAVPGSHAAQFYESERFLHRAVAAFMAQGNRLGGPLAMITSRRMFDSVIHQLALDPAGVLFVDAEQMLEHIMNTGRVHPGRLEVAVERLVGDADRIDKGGTLWIYGEMVDVLCRRGRRQAAIDLEVQWNRITAHRRPSVTACAYAMAGFDSEASAESLRAICAQHTHVFPTEHITDAPHERTRLERVILLEQRARLLESGRAVPTPKPDDPMPADGQMVYVIDDDPSVRRSLARLLAAVGMPARTFESAEAFLSEFDRSSSGCLIVDVQLLGMSGLELQRCLNDARGARWPLIAMSGVSDARVEQEALRLGAVTFLRKPFVAETLFDAIAKARVIPMRPSSHGRPDRGAR